MASLGCGLEGKFGEIRNTMAALEFGLNGQNLGTGRDIWEPRLVDGQIFGDFGVQLTVKII